MRSQYTPQRPSAKARRQRQAEAAELAAKVYGALTAALIVAAVVIATIIANSPGYERLIEEIGRI